MADAETVPVTVHILDREYRIACREDEKECLIASARYLSDRMREIRDSGNIVGMDRVAVIAALNITNELLQERDEHSRERNDTRERIARLTERIDEALEAEEAGGDGRSDEAPASSS
ncbi:cell division protein ZapA [Thiohalospira sp.]|uniref:cell division protein ZapA n=1 Tax=Thiohalospira sp. TaxID=3080549 RepID=UPI00397FC770